MSKKFKVIVNTGKTENNEALDVTQGQGARGQALVIKAKKGAKYQLQDLEKPDGAAPEYVKVKRVGKDLHILFEDSEQADVIIEDYYDVMTEGYNGVIGQAENGSFYEYIPEDPDVKGLIPELADGGQTVSVALGGAEVVPTGAAIGILAFNPLLAALGLAGAGAAAAAAAGGGTTGTTGLAITEVTDNAGNPGGGTAVVPNGGDTNDTTPSFKGTGTPGEVVTIKDGDKVVGSTTVNPDGSWNFNAPEQATGAHSYTASTPSGGTTPEFKLNIDTASPTILVEVDQPNINNTGTATVTFTLSEASTDFIKDDITVTGGTLGPLVQSSTNPLVYTATFTPAAGAAAGAIGTVKVDSNKFTDAAGNANQDGAEADNSVSITVVSGKPTTLTEVTDNVGNPGGATEVVTNGGDTNDTTPSFKGTGTPGEVVTIKDGDKIVGTTTVNPDGTWNFTAPEQATGPHSYTASTPSGGTTAPFNVNVDTTSPTILVEVDQPNINNTGTATVTFTLSEASTDFVNGDITVTGGTLGPLVQSSTNPLVYTATFTPATGATTGTVKVDSNKFSDAAGNFNNDGTEDNNADSVTITTAASNVAITLAPVTGDNIITVSEGGNATTTLNGKVTGAFTAGDVITFFVNDKTFSTTVAADGTYSLSLDTAELKADSDTKVEVSVAAKDPVSGKISNVSSAQDYTVETDALSIDPVTTDNILNLSESKATNTTVTGKVTGVFAVTDKVTLTINMVDYTATVAADGSYSASVKTTDLLADSDTKIDGSVTTSAGTAKAIQNYGVDTTPPVASVVIDPLTPDNMIDAQEAGKPTLPVTGKVTGEFTPGDKVTVTVNGNPYTGTVKPDGSFSIDVPTAELIADPDTQFEITVTVTDSAGNPADVKGDKDYGSAVSPADAKVAISLDPVTGDNIINVTEGDTTANATTTLQGKVTGAFTAGDLVTFYVNDKTFTTTLAADGTYSKAIDTADLKADTDTKVEVNAAAKDPVTGKVNNVLASQDYTVETNATNGKTVALSIDPVTADNLINKAESTTAEITVTGKVTGSFVAGDKVTLTVNNNSTYSATVAADGSYSVKVQTADLLADSDTQITGTLTNAAGTANAVQNYGVDVTDPVVTLSVDTITADNFLTAQEAGQALIAVTGKATGEFRAGDIVTLTLKDAGNNLTTYSGTVDATGAYSIDVKGADLVADADTLIEASIVAHDGGGNSTTAIAERDYNSGVTPADAKVAITLDPVTGDNIVSVTEGNNATTTLTGKVTGAFTTGDVVSIYINDKTYSTTAAADGSYSQVVNTSDLKADKDTMADVSVSAKDPTSGKVNVATNSQDYTVETASTAGKTVALAIDPVTADNMINALEAGVTNTTITGKVTGVFAVGDKVTLTVNNNSTYTAIVAAGGSYTVDVKTSDLLPTATPKLTAASPPAQARPKPSRTTAWTPACPTAARPWVWRSPPTPTTTAGSTAKKSMAAPPSASAPASTRPKCKSVTKSSSAWPTAAKRKPSPWTAPPSPQAKSM